MWDCAVKSCFNAIITVFITAFIYFIGFLFLVSGFCVVVCFVKK
ncbi:hypothetical protein HMPREF0208_02762 [Citrobacter koseri]|uniref:Uncharacterized protein n=1 Tax=Citrobacter koseri (strain ATCC BAA-895 / CDC 4225-83 / SGSC4696) TaxID=290338 RepID=A8ADU9_CITK8|nr:hypothetical protein CKO_00506 [Citrobacter koseri ATCC BAA-895]KXA01159.1 hypothetical protein HMPREF3220_01727 [Citrobacter koseri]KXA06429.1 hypothetical protein HMPREF3207_00187 [Citrobacter koseri]KXB43170.1 hypothetical protein HMPREF0208_02762 [Citrobacter koseri]